MISESLPLTEDEIDIDGEEMAEDPVSDDVSHDSDIVMPLL